MRVFGDPRYCVGAALEFRSAAESSAEATGPSRGILASWNRAGPRKYETPAQNGCITALAGSRSSSGHGLDGRTPQKGSDSPAEWRPQPSGRGTELLRGRASDTRVTPRCALWVGTGLPPSGGSAAPPGRPLVIRPAAGLHMESMR